MGQQLKKKFNFVRDENRVRANTISVIYGEEKSVLFQNAPFESECIIQTAVGPVKLLLTKMECQKRGGMYERMA